MKIYLATWLEEVSQDKALTKKNAWNRLLSYFFISKRDDGDKDFKEYANRQQDHIGVKK